MPNQNAVRAFFLLSLLLTTSFLGAAGRELAPRQIEQTSYQNYDLATAYAGDRFLTIWRESMGLLGTHVRGAFSDAEGRRISEKSFPIGIPATPSLWVELLGIGDRYILFHTAHDTMRMTELDRDGRIVADRAVDVVASRIVWNGSHFVVAARRQANYVDIHLLDRNGDRLRPPVSLDGGEFAVEAVLAGDVVLVAATGRTGTFIHSIRRDGTFDSRVLVPNNGTPLSTSVAKGLVLADAAGGGAVAVWSLHHAPHSSIWIQELARGGEPIEIPVLAIYGSGIFTPIRLARVGASYVLIYRHQSSVGAESSLFAVRVAPRSGSDFGHMITSEPTTQAATATNGHVLFAATRPFVQHYVQSFAIDANAQVQHSDVLSLSPARQLQPALAEVAGRYLAAWSELTGNSRIARSASVAGDGEPAIATTIGTQVLASRELASNGEQLLALQLDGDVLYARRLRFDGVPIDRVPLVLGRVAPYAPGASATWLRDRWVVVWPESDGNDSRRRLQFVSITADGIASAAKTLPLETPIEPEHTRFPEFTSLASDGQNALLVWSEHHQQVCWFPICDTGRLHTFATRLTADGEVIDAPLHLFEGELASTSVASSGRDYFVTLVRDARLLDVRNGMLRIAASPELFNWPVASDVTWDGLEYVVAMRYAGVNWYLATRRFNRSGNEIGAIRGTRTPAADAFEPPSVASAIAGDSLIAVHEGDVAEGMRAVVYRERDLASLPAPPQSPRNVRVQNLGFGRYEVTWDAPPGPAPEVYAVEVLENGAWIIIAVTTELRAQVGYLPAVRVRAFNAGGASPDPVEPQRRRSVRR